MTQEKLTEEEELEVEGDENDPVGRKKALERVKAFHKRKWYESLTEREKRNLSHRKEAYRQAQERAQQRRHMVEAALLR